MIILVDNREGIESSSILGISHEQFALIVGEGGTLKGHWRYNEENHTWNLLELNSEQVDAIASVIYDHAEMVHGLLQALNIARESRVL